MVNEFERVHSEIIEVNGVWNVDLGGKLGYQRFNIAVVEEDKTTLVNHIIEVVFWDQDNDLDEVEENLKNGGDIPLYGDYEVYPLV